MTPSVTSSNGTQSQSGTPTAAQAGTADKNMFLQLLVAQLKNQDPMNPTDGTQFLGEMAQFQQLEQSANMGSDIAAIRQDLDKLAPATPSGNSQS
jgi:flagellar basal-body rod modification protein FlgD